MYTNIAEKHTIFFVKVDGRSIILRIVGSYPINTRRHVRQNSNSYSHSVGGKPKTVVVNSSNKTFNKSTEVIFGDKMSAAL
jgi:hypothetical protein